ncbi:hypothetical protein LCGC14_1331120 [marine sediment metagenome]|uniref:Uncharacterized protein n=1 Tax=marine sediment metagenome TaxID=412755 RepID=A0A0F9KGM7_9ZZZZ
MERITFSEFDTDDEKLIVANRIIDNQNQIEGKLLMLISANADYNAEVEKYNEELLPKKRKGIASMKILILMCILVIATFIGTAKAYTPDEINDEIAANHVLLAQYLRDSFANITSNSFLFTPTSTAPTAAQGLVYFDSGSSTLKVSLDGSSFSPIDTAGGVSLDGAYNFGSAGGGRAIGVTDGAITMTKDDGGTENVLEIFASPSGSADGDGILVTLGANSTGVGIQFVLGAGATNDLAGTSDTWVISKVGKATFNGGGEIDTADFLFDASDAGKDLEWDDSQEALHFLDNCLLAIGGATTAAGDFVFSYDGTDFNLEAAAANDDFRMGETTHFDLSIHGETNTNVVKFDTDDSALLCIFDGFDLRMNDDDVIIFGDSVASDSFTMEFDETTDNLLIVATTGNDAVQFGSGSSSSTDVKMMASTDNDFVLFDSSANELFFEDCDLKINEGAQIEFSVGDNSIDWTIDVSTDETLLFGPSETDGTSTFNIGDATNTADVRIFGETASTVVFDATADRVIFSTYDIEVEDTANLVIGTDDEFAIDNSSETLRIIPSDTTDDFAMHLGSANNTMDVLIYGKTASELITWDAGADSLTVVADLSLFTMTGTTLPFHVNVTGTVAGEAAKLQTTDGGVSLVAGGANNGDILLTAGDDLVVDVTGTATIKGAFYPDSTVTLAKSGNFTLSDVNEIGVLILVTGDGTTITLPDISGSSAVAGHRFTIMNNAADGAAAIHLDTNANDKFLGGCGFSALDDGDKLTNTKGTADKGDFVTVEFGTAAGWYITAMNGTWADGS